LQFIRSNLNVLAEFACNSTQSLPLHHVGKKGAVTPQSRANASFVPKRSLTDDPFKLAVEAFLDNSFARPAFARQRHLCRPLQCVHGVAALLTRGTRQAGVRIWDLLPTQKRALSSAPEKTSTVLENLKRARELWWESRLTLCLKHQRWNVAVQESASP